MTDSETRQNRELLVELFSRLNLPWAQKHSVHDGQTDTGGEQLAELLVKLGPGTQTLSE